MSPHILVAGTGPVGLIAAIALAQRGLRVTLVGPEPTGDDGRTTALMQPALDTLETLDLLEAVAAKAAPLKAMRILDGTSRLIRSPAVTFRSDEIGRQQFGLNILNAELIEILAEALSKHPEITWRKGLVTRWDLRDDGVTAHVGDEELSADLLFAADGRASPARIAQGIPVTTKRYDQAALVLDFRHSRPHGFTSTEFHTETGPFTQVPLPGDRSSLVWVERPETARALHALPDEVLSRRVEDRMQSMLGRVSVEGQRQLYPLSSSLPSRFAQGRVFLLGEAAHVFPPIGAQGLNLGVRDVRDAVGIVSDLAEPLDVAAMADAYDRARRPDILARSTAVNLLNASLLSDFLPAQMARSGGLSVLKGLSPLRGFVMREGMQPGSGIAGILSSLGRQVRRRQS